MGQLLKCTYQSRHVVESWVKKVQSFIQLQNKFRELDLISVMMAGTDPLSLRKDVKRVQ